MLPYARSTKARLLAAGLAVGALVAAAPSPVHAAPHPIVALAAADAGLDRRLAVASKFMAGDAAFALAEKADREFVIELWKLIKDDDDHTEVRVAAEAAFTADPDSDASYHFIVSEVDAAYDRDALREKEEADAKRASDKARTTAAASIDVVADATLLDGSDAEFVRLIWERVADDVKWPKVKVAARAAREGSDEDRRTFIATGMAEAAKQDIDDRIAADDSKTEAQKAAERARVAKKLAANRIGLAVTDVLLDMPDRDFLAVILSNAPAGSEVKAAAVAASGSLDPAVWKAFIDTGIHDAKDRDNQIDLDRLYQADLVAAQKVRTAALAAGDLNLAHWAAKALAGSRDELAVFVRTGQFDLDVRTGFEAADIQPTAGTPITNGVVNVANHSATVATTGQAHTGSGVLYYAGKDMNTQSSYAYLKTMTVSRVNVKADTTLSYWIFPPAANPAAGMKVRNGTCVSIDLVFVDGTRLRDTQLKDQRGTRIHPQSQCSKLIADEWNQVVVPLGSLVGKQVSAVVVGYDQPANGGGYRGFIDDLAISDKPVAITDPNKPRQNYPLDNYSRNDFNNDGASDIFTRNGTTGALRLHRGSGTPDWWIEPSKTVQIGTGWDQFGHLLAVPDFTGDKNVDIIGHNAAGELKLYPGNGKGGWIGTTPTTLPLKLTDFITEIVSPGDFDRDGFNDIIARSAGDLLLYRGNGKSGFLNASSPTKIATGVTPVGAIITPGDFNGDGFVDLIIPQILPQGTLALYRGNGKGGFIAGSTQVGGISTKGYDIIASPGDFNGDGDADLVARNAAGELWVHPGDGKGSVVTTGTTRYKIGAGWGIFNTIF